MKKSIGALLFFLLLCQSSGWDGHARSGPSAGPGLKNARVLMDQGRYMEALGVLRSWAAEHPDDKNAAFLLALAAIEASLGAPPEDGKEKLALLDEAIAALRGLLVNEPGLVRVRLELARAFFYKREDGLSREHFERVLAGDPPDAVVANVRRFLSQIRARRRWTMHMGLALAPDTNIGGASDERTIYIFGLPFIRDEEELTTSGVGLAVWAGGEYQHPLGDRLRLRAGADASIREYSAQKFDKVLVSVHAGPRVLAGRNTEFSVLGSGRQIWSGGTRDHLDLGGRLMMRHRLNRRLMLNGTASWHDRRYRGRNHLDGPVRSVTAGAGFLLTPTVRLDLTAGHGRDRPATLTSRNESRWLQAGVSVALPLGFTVGGGGGYRWTDYRGNWGYLTPGGVSREDRTYNLRASVFNRAFTLMGFSPQVALVREVRSSNAQAHDYKRTSGEIRFVRQF